MTADKLRQQLEVKLHEIMSLKDKELEMEGKLARMTRQVNIVNNIF